MKKILSVLLIFVMCLGIFTACDSTNSGNGFQPPEPPDQSQNGGGNGWNGGNSSETDGGSAGEKADSDKTDIPDDLPDLADTLTVTLSEGTSDCWTIDGDTLTFSGLNADTICSVTGEFNGQIVIDAGDDYKFELELNGVKLYSGEYNPVTVLSGDKVTLTAKKSTQNYIYDTRAAISDDDETSYSAAIYSVCDLDLGGKGELVVVSANNNGIHTKDDLKVKNLTLYVTCEDNALKGNDSVTVAGGMLTLIAKTGDGIKTSNSSLSSKGNQKGTIALTSGTIDIYAACDGIDAAYNVEIGEDVVLNIYTDRYSSYSEEVETTASESSTSLYAGGFGGNGGFGGGPGGGPGGNPGGGMNDGNSEKGDYSTKGIKADNEITISGGTITVNSYDDSIHANGGETLENSETSTGNVTISGGIVTLFSKDDGVHADGTLTVNGGTIDITGSYEGLEGVFVVINGGDISIVSSDDGINATTTSGDGITFNDGNVYVYAGGDGLDSNSKTSYRGIVFAGGNIAVINTSGGDSSIDTENGYTYTGGSVLAVCPANGMTNEVTNCRNFSSVATKTTLNLSKGQTLSATVDGSVSVSFEMPCGLSAFVVYLGSSSAKISTN